MERIARTFNRLADSGETAFIPFSIAGYPDPGTSLEVFHELVDAGADILEFGFPFSDSVADGPVIQRAAAQAIRNGITMSGALDMAAEIRKWTEAPMIFFTYFNPIHRFGLERFADKAKESGLDGVLVVDAPLEEAHWLKPLTDRADLAWIYLVTPTTPEKRIENMSRDGSGFLYYVSVIGVTGSRDTLPSELPIKCRALKRVSRVPVVVGFGVSRPEQAAWLKPYVDGVVVGSAIVSRIEKGDSMSDLKQWARAIKTNLM